MIWLWVVLPAIVVLLGYGLYRWLPNNKPTAKEILLSHTFNLLLEGDRERVLDHMRHLYNQTDQDVGVGLALGNLLRAMGKTRVAIRTHRSLTTRPEVEGEVLAQAFFELAADYLASGLLDRARTALEDGLALAKPDRLAARYGEQIYCQLRDWDAAYKLVQAYGKAEGIDVAPRLGLLRHQQAEVLMNRGDADEAMAALKKAVAAHSDCLPAYLAMSRYHRDRQKPEKARALLHKHMDRFGDRIWLVMEELRQITIHDSRDDLFIQAVEKHLEEQSDDWRSRSVLGVFLTETGEYDRAADQLLTCLEEAPQVLWLHQKMWSLMLRNEKREILARYRDQVKQDLVFSKPYQCQGCGYNAEQIQWHCPSCARVYSFCERKI